ncbi:GNAT family N-acetyltransferase [Jejubacter calystegiae]|uniref:GNAT family N-acetyltransferase n=1 Tax=Jejubacter calystegiae TaxID=2579935 RepID=A0A4P8YNG7_9ENTR|nr:GNAT family N-acetyltransferase [Jejubacter calystegiae]QCT21468.1 GNAT family N-acetyltransferase [Jejubacter calystegiae]
MNISTPRFILKPISENDWIFFLALRQDETLMRYMSDVAQRAEIQALFERRLKAWKEETFTPKTWIIHDRLNHAQALGEIGIARQAMARQHGEVGYTICTAAQGKGVASETLAAVCRDAFDKGDYQCLDARVLGDNQGSIRVLEKCGFRLQQTVKNGYSLHGQYHDDLLYRLEKARSLVG